MDLEELLKDIRAELARRGEEPSGEFSLEELARHLGGGEGGEAARSPSLFVGKNATAEAAAEALKGRRVEDLGRGARVVSPEGEPIGELAAGTRFLRDLRAARLGDGGAHSRLVKAARDSDGLKGWAEAPDTAGGFLVPPEQLPGYLAKRRASSPLRERCAVHQVRSNEVWLVVEGDTITVEHVAGGATKPDTEGSVAQKVSTVFKLAGTSHVEDELLDDTSGLAGELVARQFGQQVGIAVDQAILSGTGTGEPTGILNAAGVNAQAVDGQSGPQLWDSILKAESRLAQEFFTADTVAVSPRDLVKFDTAKDAEDRYLFEGGLRALLGERLVVDANVPTTLGAGTNESVIVVGEFRASAYFFERTPLVVDASPHAGWTTDETVFRGVERYGFAVAEPGAFEVLTGITP